MDLECFGEGPDEFIDKLCSSVTGQDRWYSMAADDVIMDEDRYALGICIFQGSGFDVLGEVVNG